MPRALQQWLAERDQVQMQPTERGQGAAKSVAPPGRSQLERPKGLNWHITLRLKASSMKAPAGLRYSNKKHLVLCVCVCGAGSRGAAEEHQAPHDAAAAQDPRRRGDDVLPVRRH